MASGPIFISLQSPFSLSLVNTKLLLASPSTSAKVLAVNPIIYIKPQILRVPQSCSYTAILGTNPLFNSRRPRTTDTASPHAPPIHTHSTYKDGGCYMTPTTVLPG